MYKSLLNEYAQKAAIPQPVYTFVTEGALHGQRFKAFVILNNVQYESPPGSTNLKSAEDAAAKAALDGLLQDTSPVPESGLWKALLNEYAQRNRMPLPVYQSKRSGEDHTPTFASSVEIANATYSGGSAKTKKKAEIEAARMGFLAILSALPPLVPAPEITPINKAPQVGRAIDIWTNLRNAPRKKKGRVANVNAITTADDRLKAGPPASQAAPAPEVQFPDGPVNAFPQPTKFSVEQKILQRPSRKKLAMETLVMSGASKEIAADINTVHIHGAQKVSDEHDFEATSSKFTDELRVKKLLDRELRTSTTNDDEPASHGYLGPCKELA